MSASANQIEPGKSRITFPVLNLGVYLDRPAHQVPDGAMTDCMNVRIKDGRVRNDLLGWGEFGTVASVGWFTEEVTLLDNFVARNGVEILIAGQATDLYRWDGSAFKFITPTYGTGNASNTLLNNVVTGAGTPAWDVNVKAGDFIHVGTADHRDIGTLTDWHEVQSVDSPTQLTLVTNIILAHTNVDYTIRQVFTGDETNIWSSDTFPAAPGPEDLWMATNGVDGVVKWDGVTGTVEATSLGFTASVLRYHKNMMLYGNLVESGESKPSSVRNSALGAPENVTTDEASELLFADGVDTLLALEPLGDSIIAYCEKSVNRATFVGPPTNFHIEFVLPNKGIVSGRAIVSHGNHHQFLSHDGAYKFDGATVVEFSPQVFREVLRKLDPGRAYRTTAILVKEEADVIWVVPLTTDDTSSNDAPSVAYVEHYAEHVGSNPTPVTIRELPACASLGSYSSSGSTGFDDLTDNFNDYDLQWDDSGLASSFPLTLFGDGDGFVWTLNTSSVQNGGSILDPPTTDMVSMARFGRRPLSDGNSKGVVHRIEPVTEPREQAGYNLGVKLFTSDKPDGELVLAEDAEFDLSQSGNRFVSIRKTGRYAEVEFGTTGVSESWAISAFSVVVSGGGGR